MQVVLDSNCSCDFYVTWLGVPNSQELGKHYLQAAASIACRWPAVGFVRGYSVTD